MITLALLRPRSLAIAKPMLKSFSLAPFLRVCNEPGRRAGNDRHLVRQRARLGHFQFRTFAVFYMKGE